MTGQWKKFIQVNIYGRTLQELHREGIFLKSVLNEVGCSKTWIVEGSMYDESDHCSEDVLADPTTVLSTTVATAKVPRFSTPMISRVDRFDKFALNFPDNLSEIGSESDADENDLSNIEYRSIPHNYNSFSDDMVAVNDVVDDLISRVSGGQNDEQEPNGSFETAPVFQAPAGNLRGRRRRSAPDADPCENIEQTLEPPVKARSISKSVPIDVRGAPMTSNTSESIRATRVPDDDVQLYPVLSEMKITERFLSELSPVSFTEETTNKHRATYSEDADDFAQWHSDYDDDNQWARDDETVQIDFERSLDIHTPSEQNIQQTKSILKKNTVTVPTKPSKMVSFKVPNNQKNKETYEKLNKPHTVKCKFEGCHRTFPWKLKYGKLRLIDHALTHSKSKCLNCRSCEFTCATVRQMRYHYEKKHKEVKMERFGTLQVFSMPAETMDIDTIWKECYGDQLDIVGEISASGHKRRKQKRSEKNAKSSEETEIQSTSIPNNSENKFF